MPYPSTWEERYWTWCRAWIIPYPCRKTRRLSGWCYEFAWIESLGFFLVARKRGCENGTLYEIGWKFSFSTKPGTKYEIGGRYCVPDKLAAVGRCQTFPPPPIG